MITSFVTGGAGFIGSHLVDLLVSKGHKVVIIDNLSSGSQLNVHKKAKLCVFDILDKNAMRALFAQHKPTYVFHLAANAKILECSDKPLETFDVNVVGTLRLLELSKEYKVRSFVYSSSSSVYGEVKEQSPITENQAVDPISMYGMQKLQAEQLVRLYAKLYKLPTVALRYFNVYGSSRQSTDGPYPNVFASFIKDMKTYGKVTIYGDGMQQRDFVHVNDVALANLLAARKAQKISGSTINIGTGKATNINTISYMLDFPAIYKEKRKEDPKFSLADNKLSKKLLGMSKYITLKDGIKLLKESYEK